MGRNTSEYMKAWHAANPGYKKRGLAAHPGYSPPSKSAERRLLSAARARARARGLDFNLTVEDIAIPENCPVLGMKLVYQRGKAGPLPSSPTLDRVDNDKGYVRGNVRVISHRANALKSDGTLAELEAVVEYLRSSQEVSH